MKLNSKLILIKVDPVAEKDDTGFYISEEWTSLPQTGTVVAIGPDVTFTQVGDHVLFERYGAIKAHEEDLRLCRENQVFGVLDA